MPLAHAFTSQLHYPKLASTNKIRKRDTIIRVNNIEGEDSISDFAQNNIDQEMDIKLAMARHTLLSVAASIMCVPSEVFTTPPMIDPNPPSTPHEFERRKKITSLLSRGWSPTDGFQIPVEETDDLDDLMGSEGIGQRPSTYGEITELGARQLFHYMGLTSSSTDDGDNSSLVKNHGNVANEDHTFVDLGCGNGKLLLQAYMELPNVQQVLGIELANARYKAAIQAWGKLKKEATDVRLGKSAVVDIREGDLFQMDLSSATHVYVASLCFTDAMMQRLAHKLRDEGDKLQVVATLKPFPQDFDQRLGIPQKKFLEMSWTKSRGNGCTVYFYSSESKWS